MEKEPKKSVAERGPRRLPATAARGEDGPARTAVSQEARPGILRELGQEVKEQVRPDRGYLSIDYFTLFWLFMTGCVFGLVVETAYHAIVFGGYESRAGLVWAVLAHLRRGRGRADGVPQPVLPLPQPHRVPRVHGAGLGHRVRGQPHDGNPLGAVAWNYDGTFGSIHGRTNFAFGVMWGMLGLVWARTILPAIKHAFSHVNAKSVLVRVVTVALSAFMALDIVVTLLALDRESQRAAGTPAITWEQRFFDEHFPDSYLQARMQNMSVYGKQ